MSKNNQVAVSWNGSVATIALSEDETVLPILNQERMDSLRNALADISADSRNVTGLLIIGAHKAGFCGGADVNAIKDVTDAELGTALATAGQNLFQQISAFKCRSIALIHGPCVGGGFELALACTYRAALHTEETRIGLPEIKLGILPGFGGTVRLPRLIGLPKALEIILNGKVISAVRASNSGMVDLLVNPVGTEYAANVAALLAAGAELLDANQLRETMLSESWCYSRTEKWSPIPQLRFRFGKPTRLAERGPVVEARDRIPGPQAHLFGDDDQRLVGASHPLQ